MNKSRSSKDRLMVLTMIIMLCGMKYRNCMMLYQL